MSFKEKLNQVQEIEKQAAEMIAESKVKSAGIIARAKASALKEQKKAESKGNDKLSEKQEKFKTELESEIQTIDRRSQKTVADLWEKSSANIEKAAVEIVDRIKKGTVS